jgi:TRAP-type C4-dicarboxylate transport system permease small subunit
VNPARLAWALAQANALALALGAVAIALMMVHVSLDVAGKALLRQPITGTLEIVSTYYMVACIFLPLGWVQQERRHIAVELWKESLPQGLDRALALFADLALLVFGLLLCVASFGEAMLQTAARETSEAVAVRIEVWPSRWFPVVGSALLAAALLLQVPRMVSDWRRPAADPPTQGCP